MGALDEGSIEAFAAHLSDRGRSERTVSEYVGDLRLLAEWSGGVVPASELDDTASAWLTVNRRKGWSAATVRRRKAAVRAWARWAKVPGVLDVYKAPTPARGVAHPIVEGYDGVRAMLDVAETDEQRLFVSLCAFMALRSAEALAMRASDVDLVRRRVTVRGKGAKDRVLPIPTQVLEVLSSAVQAAESADDPLIGVTYRTAARWVAKLSDAAGLAQTAKTHDLRHTGGTHVWRKTQDLRVVQEMLGHADPRTTTIYTAVSQDAIAAGMEE